MSAMIKNSENDSNKDKSDLESVKRVPQKISPSTESDSKQKKDDLIFVSGILVLIVTGYFFGFYAALKLFIFTILISSIKDEHGWKWALGIAVIILTTYFLFGMPLLYGVMVLGGGLAALGAVAALFGLINHKPGDGSVLTVMAIGLPIMVILSITLLWNGLHGLNWWPG